MLIKVLSFQLITSHKLPRDIIYNTSVVIAINRHDVLRVPYYIVNFYGI